MSGSDRMVTKQISGSSRRPTTITNNNNNTEMKTYAFNLKLDSIVRVHAPSLAVATHIIESSEPIFERPPRSFAPSPLSTPEERAHITEASIILDDEDGPYLFEVCEEEGKILWSETDGDYSE